MHRGITRRADDVAPESLRDRNGRDEEIRHLNGEDVRRITEVVRVSARTADGHERELAILPPISDRIHGGGPTCRCVRLNAKAQRRSATAMASTEKSSPRGSAITGADRTGGLLGK